MLLGADLRSVNENVTWMIPFEYESSRGIRRQMWVWNTTYELVDANVGAHEWILVSRGV